MSDGVPAVPANPSDFEYVLYTDASHFPNKSHSGWAYVLFSGGQIISQQSGHIRTRNTFFAEIHAIVKGLEARLNAQSTLLLVDILPHSVWKKIREKLSGVEVELLSQKSKHKWHLACHHESRRRAEDVLKDGPQEGPWTSEETSA